MIRLQGLHEDGLPACPDRGRVRDHELDLPREAAQGVGADPLAHHMALDHALVNSHGL
jgi:hypothetical protein